MKNVLYRATAILCILAVILTCACTAPTASPSQSPEASPTQQATATPEATVPPTPLATVPPTPLATVAPTPEPTPEPSPEPDSIVHMKEILESVTAQNSIPVSEAAQEKGLKEAYLISDGYNVDRLIADPDTDSLYSIQYYIDDVSSIDISLYPLLFTNKQLYPDSNDDCTYAVCVINSAKIQSIEFEDYEFSKSEERARISPKITLDQTSENKEYLLIIKTTDKYEEVPYLGVLFINNAKGIAYVKELINSLAGFSDNEKVAVNEDQTDVNVDSVYDIHYSTEASDLPFALYTNIKIASEGFKTFKASMHPQLYDSKDILGADDGYVYAVFHFSSPSASYSIKSLESTALNGGVLELGLKIKGVLEGNMVSQSITKDIVIVKIPRASLAGEVEEVKLNVTVVN